MSSLAFAATENRQLGPYAVSFDMNTPMQYQIQLLPENQTPISTVYPMLIITDNTTSAAVLITQFNNPVDSTLQMHGSLAIWRLRASGFNAAPPENMTIDGKDGFLITGVPFEGANLPINQIFQAQYWLDSINCDCGPVSAGTTSVEISSSYPEDVTRNLLNTLRVTPGQMPVQAQAGQMAQPMMAQEMPPADMTQQPPQ